MGLPKVGAYAVVENMGQFNASINQVNSGIASVGQSFQKISKVNFDQAAQRFRDISSGRFVSASNVTAFSQAVSGTQSAFAMATKGAENFFASLVKMEILKGLVSNLTSGIQSLFNFGKEATFAAARADEMRLVAQYMGATIGMSANEVDDMITQMTKAGIEYEVAAKAVARLTQENLGLEHAVELVRIAQASAIVSSRTSSDVLDDIIYGITTLQPRVLRTNGIMVGLQETIDELSDSTGTSAKELDNHSKQLAFLDNVVEKGTGLLNLYDTAMQEPMKKWRSLPRVGNEIQVAFGKPFKDVFNSIVDTITYLAKGFRDALLPGGAFHDMLYGIGAVASIVFDNLGMLARNGFTALTKALGDTRVELETTGTVFGRVGGEVVSEMVTVKDGIISRLTEAATSAFEWGVNIVAELADGIISGASTVLVGAMDFISNMLFAWLAPGSPPRVAPGIDQWGAATMDEYLKGFSAADFDVLDAVQAPLKQVLDIVGRGDEFTQFSLSLADAISTFEQTGQVSQGIYDQLASIGGVYGDELTRLVDLQFQMAAATKAAEDADKAYNASRKKVTDLTAEYNRLLREGASEDVLKAKLAEINAAEKEQATALQAKKDAEGQIDIAKEQLALQEKLIANLLELAKAQDKAKEPVGGEKKPGGGGGAGKPTPIPGGGIIPDIGANIDAQMANLKDRIVASLQDAFAPLRNKWANSIRPTLTALLERFRKFYSDVKMLVGEGLDTFRRWWTDNGPSIIMAATQISSAVTLAFDAIRDAIGRVSDRLAPFVGEQLRKLSDWFIENGPLITTFANQIGDAMWLASYIFSTVFPKAVELGWGIIEPILAMAISNILDIGKFIMAVATGDWKTAWEAMLSIVDNIWTAIKDLWINFADWVGSFFNTTWEEAVKWWSDSWDRFRNIVKIAWYRIQGIVGFALYQLATLIFNRLTEIKTTIETKFSEFGQAIKDALDGINTKVDELLGSLVTLFTEKFGEIAGAIWALVGEEGPFAVLASIFESGGRLDRAISWFKNNVLYYFQVALNGIAMVLGEIIRLAGEAVNALRGVTPPGWGGGGGGGEQSPINTPSFMPSLPVTQTVTPASMVSTRSVTVNVGRVGGDRPMSDAVTISRIRQVVANEVLPF